MNQVPQLTMTPCTLVYTLFNPKAIKFDDFYLLIRSLHNFLVEDIIPNPELNNVHVKLKYQASIKNAIKKLGGMAMFTSVSKLSNFVKDDELIHLEYIKQQYGVFTQSDGKPMPYIGGRGKYKKSKYINPPNPYSKRPRQKSIQPAETYIPTRTYPAPIPESEEAIDEMPNAQLFPQDEKSNDDSSSDSEDEQQISK